MQELIASVDHIKFDLEVAVEQQLGAQPLPFPGMDKSGAAVCEFFLKAACGKGGMCPFRHISGEKTVVCKHWLRGLCKKGDQCEFLHEYDMTKMPECYFYSKFGECSNKECPFLHIDPESKIKDCPWYDRGFCKHGPLCRHRHTRRVICVNYLVGFCPEGPTCKFMQGHPKSLESCSLKITTLGTEDRGHWSRSPATSVVKKVIMPTDAPKDIWPFSVDSERAGRRVQGSY
ncbi:cleavage and polyadenylation specificity factor subunit 4 isoform X3 [Falco naumanni]|uniref:cleavage and polyadenylation specificity factor subunit 4 isoform X3 n=1 Tax=Falco naumanni TaxID=148594 RepID=UPI001ADE84C6|nr:cleavage and polyadenylation specificity factor subunit 4 isoform X3 [Falco naumanni]